jgi:hypothetical protein
MCEFLFNPVIYRTILFCWMLRCFSVLLLTVIILKPYNNLDIQKDLYTKACKKGLTPPGLNPHALSE